MNSSVLGSILLSAIIISISTTAAYADHPKALVINPPGSSIKGCEVTDECFIPSVVTVEVGGEVTWRNDDTAAHTVTSGSIDDGPDGVFDSSLFLAGTEFSHTFEAAGEYPYYCLVHPWMAGMVVVAESESAPMDKHEDEPHEGESMPMDKHEEKPYGDTRMEKSASGMLSDGTKVGIMASEPAANEIMTIDVKFYDSEHTNYDIMVTQNGETVLEDLAAHEHEGHGTHTTAPLNSDDPVEVTITFQGFGVSDPKTGPVGEVVTFTNIVPEFGVMAMLILAVAIVSIIAITASRFNLVPRI